mmetsp:Transcript_40263/g.93279  ORF Transcript_40263/g.93279 Transcript_40263/m.93279 type:complete len:305 (+) Transcript_40263:355-1269(+)
MLTAGAVEAVMPALMPAQSATQLASRLEARPTMAMQLFAAKEKKRVAKLRTPSKLNMSTAQTRSSSVSSIPAGSQCTVLSARITAAFMTNVMARSSCPTQAAMFVYTRLGRILPGGAGSTETSPPAPFSQFRAALFAASLAASTSARFRDTVWSGLLGQVRSAESAVPTNTSTFPMKTLMLAAQFAGTFSDPAQVDTDEEAAPSPNAVFTINPIIDVAHRRLSSSFTGRLFSRVMRSKSHRCVIELVERPMPMTRPTLCPTSTRHNTLLASGLIWPSSTSGNSFVCPSSTSRLRKAVGRSPSKK